MRGRLRSTFGRLLGEASLKLAFLALNAPAVFGAYRRRTDIVYGPDARHRLDAYLPERPAARPAPLVVFWHGGRWSSGDKGEYRFVAAALAELGYATAVPNYRLYPQVKMPGFMEDAARAASWAAEHAAELGADAGRLYFMGHSAGAHIAALLALDARYFASLHRPAPRIEGVIGLSGAYDFLPLREDDVRDIFGPPELYAASQPINFVSGRAPPMLLIHGAKDTMVSPHNSRNLAAALAAQGVASTLKMYPKLMHADTVAALSLPARRRAGTLGDVAAFVNSPDHVAMPPGYAMHFKR
jgi:acetyl esterase/lipase